MLCVRFVFHRGRDPVYKSDELRNKQVKLHSARVLFILNPVNSVGKVEETLWDQFKQIALLSC